MGDTAHPEDIMTPTLRATVTPSPTTPDGSEAPSKLILIN